MKKIMTFVLAMVLSVVAVFAFTGCGATKKKLVVYTEIELTAETYAFAVNKSNTTLKNEVNSILAGLEESGELDNIINSFFDGNAEFAYTNPTAPTASNRSNYFVVGTNAFFPPFEYYEGSKLSGIDMQIASIIATELGKTLYIKDMEFDSLIPSVEIGEVDIAMAGMTVNEERLKTVDFTEGYYTSAQVITVAEGDKTFAECTTAADVEAILAQKGKGYKVGTQNGTTGYMYSAGDEGFGYTGFANLTTKGYTTGALAMQDLRNGKINAVILDKQPSIMIATAMNK
jgi:polar amino acid transport system substrate-binding protein